MSYEKLREEALLSAPTSKTSSVFNNLHLPRTDDACDTISGNDHLKRAESDINSNGSTPSRDREHHVRRDSDLSSIDLATVPMAAHLRHISTRANTITVNMQSYNNIYNIAIKRLKRILAMCSSSVRNCLKSLRRPRSSVKYLNNRKKVLVELQCMRGFLSSNTFSITPGAVILAKKSISPIDRLHLEYSNANTFNSIVRFFESFLKNIASNALLCILERFGNRTAFNQKYQEVGSKCDC